ncbi:MAG TPA: tetratricopeptide repeat protein [Spirochaetia bacterium]|nr:tetratricopeptide repeat protein [Spirochaetia bacterium]
MKGKIIQVLIVGAAAAAGLSSCQEKLNENVLEQIVMMETPTYKGGPISPETVERVRSALAQFEGNIKDTVQATGQLGTYYRLLAKQYVEIEELKQEIAALKAREENDTRRSLDEKSTLYQSLLFLEYIDREMYGEALDQIRAARSIYPESPTLFYYAGLCSARVGKSMTAPSEQRERDRYYADAAAYYRRSVELDPGYFDSVKGLAVLEIFELGQPAQAESVLVNFLDREPGNSEAKFLLARVYFETGRAEAAVDLYEDIAAEATSEEMRDAANANIERIRGGR